LTHICGPDGQFICPKVGPKCSDANAYLFAERFLREILNKVEPN